MSILRAQIKHVIKSFRDSEKCEDGLHGWDLDLLGLIDDLYQYTLILEERIEKLEEERR